MSSNGQTTTMDAPALLLENTLPAGTILIVDDCKKRLACEEENGSKAGEGKTMPAEEERKDYPERYPVFKIDFSGMTLKEVLEDAFGRTAYIDTYRKRFREMPLDTAQDTRLQFMGDEDERPTFEMTVDEMITVKRKPLTEEEKKKRALDKVLNTTDADELAKVIEMLKKKQEEMTS